MHPDEMEHLLTEHRLDGPGADLRARTLARAEAAWRNGDGVHVGGGLDGVARTLSRPGVAGGLVPLAAVGAGGDRGACGRVA